MTHLLPFPDDGAVPPDATPVRPNLAPWDVLPRHKWSYALTMLRTEERRRAWGDEGITEREHERLSAWLRWMAVRDVVLDYDPTNDDGFRYLPRRPGLDTDLVRDPSR